MISDAKERGALTVGLVLVVASWSYATPVTVQVTGQVTQSDFLPILPNTTVAGSYTYDNGAAYISRNDTPSSSKVVYPLESLTLGFADGSTMISSTGQLSLWRFIGGSDLYDVYTDSFTTLTGSFAPPSYAEIVVEDPTATLLGGFPTIPDPANLVPLLPADGSRAVRMDMEAGVSFEITGLSAAAPATPVPAPGAAWLALLGLAGTGWLRRRKTM